MNEIDPVTILLAEDNDNDIVIIQRAFKKLKLLNSLQVVNNGIELLEYLSKVGEDEDHPQPGLILLDINMPRMDGFEVLEKLKDHPEYKKIPVIMLTSSNREEDIVKSYEHGACSYITKPVGYEEFVEKIEQFNLYWSLVSKTPNTE